MTRQEFIAFRGLQDNIKRIDSHLSQLSTSYFKLYIDSWTMHPTRRVTKKGNLVTTLRINDTVFFEWKISKDGLIRFNVLFKNRVNRYCTTLQFRNLIRDHVKFYHL